VPTPPTPASTAEPAEPTPALRTRDPWFDNAKMALVTLVVVGHSWVLLPGTGFVAHLYDFLYAWHVPAFVLVTGYLSRTFTYSRARLWQLVRTVAVPYLVFETLLALFRTYVGGEHLQDLYVDPHWPLWYLTALFFWRLVTPLVRPLPAAVAVPAALAVSFAAGAWAGPTLDVARILGLLPFFVVGLKATPERLEVLRRPRVQVAAVVALVGIFVVTRWTDSWGSREWLYYRSRYDEMGFADGDPHALLVRALVLALGFLGAGAFLALVPRGRGWFTRMGASTLVVYLCHGFVVKGAGYAAWDTFSDHHVLVSFPITTAMAVLLAMALASRPVASRLIALVDPGGYAARHVDRAVDLAASKDQVQPTVQAELERLVAR
jgi:fucose 4-O-acetylase-like acetyltransferase